MDAVAAFPLGMAPRKTSRTLERAAGLRGAMAVATRSAGPRWQTGGEGKGGEPACVRPLRRRRPCGKPARLHPHCEIRCGAFLGCCERHRHGQRASLSEAAPVPHFWCVRLRAARPSTSGFRRAADLGWLDPLQTSMAASISPTQQEKLLHGRQQAPPS